MLRPIRLDTPKGKAAQSLQTGVFCAFILAPLLVVGQVLQSGGQWRGLFEGAAAVLPAVVVIPSVAVLSGLMLMYDGWWRLRKLS